LCFWLLVFSPEVDDRCRCLVFLGRTPWLLPPLFRSQDLLAAILVCSVLAPTSEFFLSRDLLTVASYSSSSEEILVLFGSLEFACTFLVSCLSTTGRSSCPMDHLLAALRCPLPRDSLWFLSCALLRPRYWFLDLGFVLSCPAPCSQHWSSSIEDSLVR
jgi:hypothetical protein